jgi:hypothetical protein
MTQRRTSVVDFGLGFLPGSAKAASKPSGASAPVAMRVVMVVMIVVAIGAADMVMPMVMAMATSTDRPLKWRGLFRKGTILALLIKLQSRIA